MKFFSCDLNPFCKWFTYDAETALCYMKDQRGYLVNKTRTEGKRFTSGATFRDGCAPDPCEPPYSYQESYQCLYFTAAKQSFLAAKEACEEYGGFVPYTYSGFTPGRSDQSR